MIMPLELAYYIIAAVIGLSSPMIAVRIISASLKCIQAMAEETIESNKYRRYMDSAKWYFRRAVQCPNPDYISLSFMNSVSEDIIDISVEKKHLKRLFI